jgi:hypothetical protein
MKNDILQAIITKRHNGGASGATRVSAKCAAQRIWLPWNHALNVEDNHRVVAEELQRRMKWDDKHELVGGGMPDDSGYCWVQVPKA